MSAIRTECSPRSRQQAGHHCFYHIIMAASRSSCECGVNFGGRYLEVHKFCPTKRGGHGHIRCIPAVAINIRPMRGALWRASTVYQRPLKKTRTMALKSIGFGSAGTPMSPR